MLVLHVGLRPLCKWFSVQLLPLSGEFHFGISLLVAQFMRSTFFFFSLKVSTVLCSDLRLMF